MTEKRHVALRRFNRSVFNRLIKLFAGRFFYALVLHIGRVSGKTYSTPVLAVKKDDAIFIPLPYGADTDWFLNVMAAGGCRIQIKSKWYETASPAVVDALTALPYFSASLQKAFNKAKVEQFLRLGIGQTVR